MSESNDYMQQVMAKQQAVEVDLKAKRMLNRVAAPRPAMAVQAAALAEDTGRFRRADLAPVAAADEGSNAVEVRITGWWRWRTVVVPPNAHVVHTRRGHDKPLHLGLGVSFRYNPAKDSFLVVPGTMQTIMINAYCICRELQGLLVQGYVQWIIQDFATAYKKLDFTDSEDPMRLVNVQLREQAEAAIKDKVATMGIDEVLSDKQPIIEELTARLRSVAEGEGTDKGLGLRIVTVQIKEAVVSSKRVWENLQKPFRAERARIARLAELEAETVIAAREQVAARDRETNELTAEAELAKLRAARDAETFDREQQAARHTGTERHETWLQASELEKVRIAREAEVARLKAQEQAGQQRAAVESALAVKQLQRDSDNRQIELELGHAEARQRIANSTSQGSLQAKLIDALPVVAEKLPKPSELKSIAIGGNGHDGQSLAALVAQVMAIVDGFRTTNGA